MRVVPAVLAAAIVLSQAPAFGARASTPVASHRLERAGSSPAVRSLPAEDLRPIISQKIRGKDAPKKAPLEVRNLFANRSQPEAIPDADAALWSGPEGLAPEGGGALVSGAVQFEGLGDADNESDFGFGVTPPDTNHDVGPNHIVETTNLLVRIYDKSGTPLVDPFRMSALFGALGAPCSTNDDGDPIVLYDQLADRWLISQFTYEPPQRNRFCIGVSKTPDPTGEYWVYELESPINAFQDYPHYGVWADGYYIATNMFNTSLTSFIGVGVFALERDALLAGAEATILFSNLASVDGSIYGMLPSDLDGSLPPPPGAPNVFAYYTATEYGDTSDALRLFDFHADFDTPASSSFSEREESPVFVAAFNPLEPSGRRDILQKTVSPGVASCSNAVDSLASVLMHRLQYRRLCDGTERLAVNHTVNVNGVTVCSTSSDTYRAGVRLYELQRSTGTDNSFAVANQVTFAPGGASGPSRWMGSAALDHQGNLAIGYSATSPTLSPSLRAAGRLAADPKNALPQGEITLVAGSGMMTDTAYNRWGDYSMLAVDPVDECTFWYAQEYVSAASQAGKGELGFGWATRIGNFRFDGCEDLLFCTDFEAGTVSDWTQASSPSE